MSETVSFRIDGDLAGRLEDVPNKSKVVREAIREHLTESGSRHYPNLSDEQARAYDWLRDYQPTNLGSALAGLAQRLQINKELVKLEILRPLERKGYLRIESRLLYVGVEILDPRNEGKKP